MDTIGKRIREARIRAGLTASRLAELLDVSASAINQYESDRSSLALARAVKLAEILGVSLQWLVEGAGPSTEERRSKDAKMYAPLLNRVQAGQWGDVITPHTLPEDVRYLEVDMKPLGYALALEIDGESMLPTFEPKDIIIIDTGLEPLPGDFVVAMVANDSQATFKKYRPRGYDQMGNPIIELAPLNQDYPTLVLNHENPGRIVGTMTEHRKYRRRR